MLLCQPLPTAFARSHCKVTDDTLESSVVDSDVIEWFRSELPQCTNAPHPPLSILADAAMASSGTCHCSTEWHNFSVYLPATDQLHYMYHNLPVNAAFPSNSDFRWSIRSNPHVIAALPLSSF